MSATLDFALLFVGVVVGMLVYEVFVRTLALRWRLLIGIIVLWAALAASSWIAR